MAVAGSVSRQSMSLLRCRWRVVTLSRVVGKALPVPASISVSFGRAVTASWLGRPAATTRHHAERFVHPTAEPPKHSRSANQRHTLLGSLGMALPRDQSDRRQACVPSGASTPCNLTRLSLMASVPPSITRTSGAGSALDACDATGGAHAKHAAPRELSRGAGDCLIASPSSSADL